MMVAVDRNYHVYCSIFYQAMEEDCSGSDCRAARFLGQVETFDRGPHFSGTTLIISMDLDGFQRRHKAMNGQALLPDTQDIGLLLILMLLFLLRRCWKAWCTSRGRIGIRRG